jgi:hypothetical protein
MATLGTGSRRVLIQLPAGGLESIAPPAGGDQAPPGWVAATPGGRRQHPWDEAHAVVRQPPGGLESVAAGAYAEPDFVQSFPFERPDIGTGLESAANAPCGEQGPDLFWPIGTPAVGWHLDDAHSGLRAARERVGVPVGRRVRIGILDTGYDPSHVSKPLFLLTDRERNFYDEDTPNDATDPGRHSFGNQPGHGTATMALLAGNRVAIPGSAFDDFIGGAPQAEVVPIRVADSVVHFRTSAVARGLEYAIEAGCDVVSISMGGVPTRAWAAAVNRCYEAGVAIFAAAGNRFGPAPPSSIVYPARFNRATAVCGATADNSPYYRPGLHRNMQGCFGPPAKMATAIAAYTPNALWAVMGCQGLVGYGGGTSSATPQAASAAALWLQHAAVPNGVEPWQKVEAVRFALFASADRAVPDRERFFGNGLLRAAAALEVPFRSDLPQASPDDVSFPWLRLLGALEAVGAPPTDPERMYEVEALQVFLQTPALQEAVGDADPVTDQLTPAERKKLIDAMWKSPRISESLRGRLNELHRMIG